MTFRHTITAAEMRSINRSAVLEIIRRQSPISRTEIADKLKISLPTVMRIIDELLADDLVRSQAETEPSGGRPRALLEFNTSGHAVIGVDLGASEMFGAVTDLGGTILEEINLAHHGSTGEASFARLVELIERLLHSPKLEGRPVRGIGIGAPGITLHPQGVVQWSAGLNWRNYPLKEKLIAHFNMAVTVENDVNLAALGELWHGAGMNTQNMVLMTVGPGIGAAIVIDGLLYRGANQSAGEIGYLMPGRQFLAKRYDDGLGALETVASDAGIVDRARKALKDQLAPEELDALSAEAVFDAMRRGEAWATPIIEEAVDYLAITIAAIGALIDPEVIVLAGSMARSADVLLQRTMDRINNTIPLPTRIMLSQLGPRAVVLGAITTVLHNTSDYYIVQKLS